MTKARFIIPRDRCPASVRSCIAALVLLLLLASCAAPRGRELAATLASRPGWRSVAWSAGDFTLRGFARPGPGSDLVVYIEGDGRAYLNRRTPSTDPTPDNPLALRLALADPGPKVLYLGRPCQYVQAGETCSMRYWTLERYGEEVVRAMDTVLDRAKADLGATRLYLVGYSGGGALAVLLAARRDDVAALVTVAGNLDHKAWTALHKVSPLTGSLNPADYAAKVRHIPQVHFVGEDDEIVPVSLAREFARGLGNPAPALVEVVPDVDHTCCWPRLWPELLRLHAPWLRGGGAGSQ